jgi:hypothetical protein
VVSSARVAGWSPLADQAGVIRRRLRQAPSHSATRFKRGRAGTIISLFALKELGFEAGPLAMIFAVGGVSSLLGSVLVRPVTRALGVGLAMIAGLLVAGLLLMPLTAAQGHGAFAAACLLVQQLGDGALSVFLINEVSLRQTIVAPGLMGRVNSSAEFLRSVARLTGVLVAGLAAEIIGLRATLGLGGAVVILGAIFLALTSVRSLKTMPAGATPALNG